MRWLRLGIRGRIYCGFGSLLAVGLLPAGVALWALFTIDRAVEQMDAASDHTLVLRDVGRNVEIMRGSLHRNNFNAEDDANGSGAARIAIERLQHAINGTRSDEQRKIYQGMAQEVGAFEERRVAWVRLYMQLQTEMRSLRANDEELAKASDRLLAATTAGGDGSAAAIAGEVETAVLLARVAGWRPLAFRAPLESDAYKSNLGKARAALADLERSSPTGELHALIPPLRAVLDRCAASFEVAANDGVKINQLYNQLLPLLAKVRTDIDGAENRLHMRFADARGSADATIATTITAQEAVGGFAMILGVLLALWIARTIIRPVASMTDTMKQLASGDPEAEIPGREAADEIGAMARALETFRQNAVERVRLQARMSDARADAERQAEMRRLADEFEREIGAIVATVSSASSELESSAKDLSLTAQATQQLSAGVATASEQASTNVRAVASAADQLAGSVDKVASQVQESNRIAHEAVGQARATDALVAAQSEAAARVSEVIKLITTIADQTNLLALNATIEAARAGQAGRGFAVVAQEVKTLALETGKATGEIARQIAGIQAASADSIVAIKGIAETIYRISEITLAVSAAIEEQSASTRQIAHNSAQAEERTSDVLASITKVDRDAGATGSASQRVLASAKSLAGDSSDLKAKVDKFLATVRAA